jgi:hypothetical protein
MLFVGVTARPLAIFCCQQQAARMLISLAGFVMEGLTVVQQGVVSNASNGAHGHKDLP